MLEGLGRDLMRGLNSVKRITQEQQLEDKVGAGGAGSGGATWVLLVESNRWTE